VHGHGLIPPARRVPVPGDGPQTLATLWDRTLDEAPGREAVVSRHARLSYAGLEEKVNAAAAALAGLGVGPGDRVAASMGNHAELVVAFFAVARLGAVWAGVNRALAPPEKVHALAEIRAGVLIADRRTSEEIAARRAELVDLDHVVDADPAAGGGSEWAGLVASHEGAGRPAQQIDPFAPAAISFTSGTTGWPKAAVHSQHNMVVVAAQSAARAAPDAGTGRTGVCLPLTLLNLMILGPVLSAYGGGTAVLIDRTDPVGLAEWVRAERVGTISVVPTILHDLLVHPDVDFPALTRGLSLRVGGSDCPPAWRQLFREHGLAVNPTYGLTEAPTGVTMGEAGQPDGSCGRALPHLRLVVVDEKSDREVPPGRSGEICVGPAPTGPWAGVYTPMLGYWDRPEESARALRGGVLHTGDVGHLDADGYLYIEDRRDDLIVRGGANVYPAEVERALAADARVAGSAVVGVADDRLGQRVVAAVELGRGATASPEELIAHCAAQLARYKVPAEIRVVPALPRTEMGKVRRRAVRALFEP
jgi:long-chain acyl-CoA synthetase